MGKERKKSLASTIAMDMVQLQNKSGKILEKRKLSMENKFFKLYYT
jgi:hypothetical protein